MTYEPTSILIIVLVVAAIWAVTELALTLRKTRNSVGKAYDSMDDAISDIKETLTQVQPIIAKVDGALDDLQPAVKEVQPLVERIETTVDVATVSLAKVNEILGDVSEVSGSAASVSATVKNVTSNAASNMAGAVGRFSRGGGARGAAKLGDGGESRRERKARSEAPKREAAPSPQASYVTYVPMPAQADGEPEADDAE